MNQKLFLGLIVVLVTIGSSMCQNNDMYQSCRQTFQCGALDEIGYPFYGGERPLSCGYPGFELTCIPDEDPLITTASIGYRVLDHHNSTRTLKVSRLDLWDTLCPPILSDTSLNLSLYNFYAPANDQNITIYYGCPTPAANQPIAPPTQFNCNLNGINGNSSFFVTQATSLGEACSRRISVRVNQSAALELANTSTASILGLENALQSGFTIQWSAEDERCRACLQSGGFCGYNQTFACHCSDATFQSTCNGPRAGSRNGPKLHIILPLGIAGLIALSIIVYYITKQPRVHHESNHNVNKFNVDKFLLNHGSLAPKRYSYKEIKKITKSFTDKLGQGGYGIVYKGEIPGGQIVAVKVLTQTHDDAQEFINEVASISRTSHVNIVNLLGFCYDGKKRALVYEFMPNKSLDKFISNQECSLEWEKLFEITVGVARGLEYLHRGCNTRIVHFDIKPQNILLDEDFCPKISDFGLAQLFKKKQSIISTVGARGTIGYIAPEVFFRSFGVVSHKSDVYSYGMMLLEMAEANTIGGTGAIQSSESYFPDRIYEYVLLKKELGDLIDEEKEESKRKMLLVGLWCIQTAPSDRPSMTKVVEMIEGSLQSIQIPPKPLLSTPKQSVPQFSSSFSAA